MKRKYLIILIILVLLIILLCYYIFNCMDYVPKIIEIEYGNIDMEKVNHLNTESLYFYNAINEQN